MGHQVLCQVQLLAQLTVVGLVANTEHVRYAGVELILIETTWAGQGQDLHWTKESSGGKHYIEHLECFKDFKI